ncbi:hypothetical protein OTB20_08345 [Streptomyces sp. H27-H1]|uniref:hypothetical protein n=1 Tax=Streptomyces sp. H27-H1 TaxID=2996461 RepID=UPI002271A410|nr:hypothetical protein [Streptomyces sp. H27-H1]MCY0926214.1 hypothetical protein [Streptomyces sp. H27-H1]
MSLIASLLSETWTIQRAGTPIRDSTGSYVPGPRISIDVPNSAVISPYGVTVGSSSETSEASETVTTRRVFAAPLDTDLRAGDRITRNGETYEVIGRPLVFPLTSLARIEAAVQEVTG